MQVAMTNCQNNCSYITPDIIQTPDESILYTVDWTARGLPDGLTIESQEFFPGAPTDYEISNEDIPEAGLSTVFQLTGGTPGITYAITDRVTLSSGEILAVTLFYQCVAFTTQVQSAVI